ncbi:MAG: DUF2203 domain-containing protein [Phycisphaerales bacterium]|nr:DUF2203 domain-containing protein [Phycisphaerales bacterium]
MPGPQSTTPKPVAPSRPRRRFRLSQATQTLPLVSRIVADIVRTHSLMRDLEEKLTEDLAPVQQQLVQEQIEQALSRLHGYVDELNGIGCELKDPTVGLIDFIGLHQGREVCLCWKPGETAIGYWHELDAGFNGRQPVSVLEEEAE